MKIESTDQDIRTLLSSGYYRIPRFQRPYSWTREEIQDFWNDIVRDNPVDYFIGSMVVFKDGNQRYGVVDGQQRLTTIAIFLVVLRNTFAKKGFEDLAAGINGLIERKNIENKPEFILSTETSYPFLQDHILKWGKPDVPVTPKQEEKNLEYALQQLDELVGDAVQSYESDSTLTAEKKHEHIKKKLVSIRDAILNLKIINVKLDNEDDAYLIFETLNTRGKDLSLTDLVKNHITKHLKAKSASVDQTKIKWERILETIEGSSCDLDTDTFIHHFWLSRYDYLPAKSLFKKIKQEIGKDKANKFLSDLIADAAFYRSVYDLQFGKWSKQERSIANSLSALQLFRVQQQTPCVLSLVRAYKERKIKMRHLEDAIDAIEKFHFLFTAVTSQRSSGGISGMYASLGRRLFEATDINEALPVIKELKNKLKERIPIMDEVKALFPEIVYTNGRTKQRGLVKYILATFMEQATTGVTPDFDAMTIEHLVSQDRIGSEGFTEAIVGQLGNLILVSGDMNGSLDNKPFKEKKQILKEKGYSLPSEIDSATDWTVDAIKNRTEEMAIKAYNVIWKI